MNAFAINLPGRSSPPPCLQEAGLMLHEETKAKRPPSAQQPTKAAASPGEKKSKPMDSRKYPCPNTNCTGIMVPRWPDPITYDAAVYVCPTCKQEVRVIKVLGIEDQ